MLSTNTLNMYAALRRWISTRTDGPLESSEQPPHVAALWLVRFKGRDRDGLFDRIAYLCLSEAEARMVVGTAHGPNPVRSPVAFDTYLNASYEVVSLQQGLADEVVRHLLHVRLKKLMAYAAEDYERATQAYLCMERGVFQALLWDQAAALIKPDDPRSNLPSCLRWEEPQVVWDEAGLAGVVGPEGQLLVPCQYSLLREKSGTKMLQALRGPLPEVREPVDPRQLLLFSCDVIDSFTGQRINPPGVSALWGALAFDGVFVAVNEAQTQKPLLMVGLMSREGRWIGKAEWADLRSFRQGRAAVCAPQHQRWGYIDEHGRVVIEPQYLWAGSFSGGRAFVQEDHGGTAAWLLIDRDGKRITGPWTHIDEAQGDNLVAQAMEDDGTQLWSLLDLDGRVLVERMAIPPNERFRKGQQPDLVAEAAHHLSTLWHSRRKDLALSLRHLPLKDRVERFRPNGERDLVQLGLWGRRVRARHAVENMELHGIEPQCTGMLAVYYPVTLNIYSLLDEAPVTFERNGGKSICIGVPWGDLELVDPEG